MSRFSTAFRVLIALFLAAAVLDAAAMSQQQADAFARKLDLIAKRGEAPRASAVTRTPVTETELNSWFMYRAQPLLPSGISDPKLTIVGNGKVMGTVTVDLEQVAKKHASSGSFDPLGYLGGRVPVSVSGILKTKDGRGQFDLQAADISGVPVPKPLMQELLSYYSRTPEHPDGVRLDAPFPLPANIREIEVAQGEAVVVQ
jgi:hypothetical protein